MYKHKYWKNDQPKKREKYWRLFYRKTAYNTSNILGGVWLPATKARWRTQEKEIEKEWAKYNE